MTTYTITVTNQRLLKMPQAASYLNMSIKEFRTICPVAPIDLGTGRDGLRYDRADLDQWLESIKSSNQSARADQLIETL